MTKKVIILVKLDQQFWHKKIKIIFEKKIKMFMAYFSMFLHFVTLF